MLIKRIQLSLIHVAVAMTLVPINSALNRVMIKEMAISATLVAILASLPYIFSPMQVLIGSYSDRHPLFGWRRTPYILAGLVLCVAGVALAPQAVYLMPDQPVLGLGLSLLVFMAWGMGYNLSAVSYLSLASELSGEKGRSRTVGLMWFMMIVGIILTAAALSRLLRDYSPGVLNMAFLYVALAALAIGLIGLVRLEPRNVAHEPRSAAHEPRNNANAPEFPVVISQADESRMDWRILLRSVMASPQARHFFLYLILLLAAILGQDVLLEPFGGEALELSVEQTTRITSIWGTCMLAAFLAANLLETRIGKKGVARSGAWIAIAGFLLISGGGLVHRASGFYTGVMLLGFGSGLSTISNLSLMFDMTTTQVGLFMGAWGVANALSRLIGTLLAGVLRDVVAAISGSNMAGYVTVFVVQAGFLAITLLMLGRIDVARFNAEAEPDLTRRAAALNDAG